MSKLIMSKNRILVVLIAITLLSSIIQFGKVLNFNLHIFELSILLLLIYNIFNFKLSKPSFLITIIYFPVLFFSVVNSVIEGNINNFIVFAFYYLAILSCFFSGYNLNNDDNMLKLLKSYVVINLLIHIIGFIRPNPKNVFLGFSGVFSNPNVYGMFCSISIVFLWLVLASSKNKLNLCTKIYLLINLIGLLSSVSRTAFSAFAISIFLYYFFILLASIRNVIKKKWLYSTIAIIVSFLLAFYMGFFDKILKKTSGLDDVSNGRFDLWAKAYNSLKFYGYGHEYYGVGEQATHNNYLNIGVVFGASVMIALTLFWFFMTFISYYLYCKYKVRIVAASTSILSFSLYYWIFEVGSSFVFIWIALIVLGYSYAQIYNLRSRV